MARREAAATLRTPTPRQLERQKRERRIQLAIFGVMAGTILLVLLFLGIGLYREGVARYQEPIVSIGDRTFSMGDYVEFMKYQDFLLDQQAALLAGFGISQAQQIEFQRSILSLQAIEDMVDAELSRVAATQLGISVAPEEVDAELRERFLGSVGEDETSDPAAREQEFLTNFDSVVAQSGISADYFRRMTESDLLRQRLQDHVGAQIPTVQEHVKVRGIVLSDEDSANQALERIRNGEDFAAVASEVSTDTATKDSGGDMGWMPRGVKDRAIEDAAFALQPGQVVTAPVQALGSYYVLKVEERENREVSESDLSVLKANAFQDFLDGKRQEIPVSRYITSEKQTWAQERVSRAREQRLRNAS